jgi:hypothetical protein
MQKVSDNEIFITLISAAEEDSDFAKRLLAITQLPELERKIKVLQLVKDSRKEKAPADFISALLTLGEEKIARKVCTFLGK